MRPREGAAVKEVASQVASVAHVPQLALVPRVAAFELERRISARHDVEREQAAIVAARRCHDGRRAHRGAPGVVPAATPEERPLELEDRLLP